ncbi:DOCK-like protein 1 [Nakaseomyces bracarensis]|uniref:DOCK-like protein 1 n=1 Tax=Nakaseomyces bracarensis TaxID=273131 RepID=A0ABR4NT52_9SACH
MGDIEFVPLDGLQHGVMIRSFLPLLRHPELVYHNHQFLNVYVGAEVYVFEESSDGEWCRGYFCSRPFPEEFIANTSSTNEKLPDVKPLVCIFPKKFATFDPNRIIHIIPFFKAPEMSDFISEDLEGCNTPSLYETLQEKEGLDVSSITHDGKPTKPPFPYFRYQKRPFVDEMGPVLSLLCSHIYWMYSFGEFDIYSKLVGLYYDLDNIRLRLRMHLTTDIERIKITRAANSLLAKISKFISSKGRTNRFLLDVRSSNPDPYGFEGIFARDIITGELLSFDKIELRTLVLSSMLYGLTNNFPNTESSILQIESPKCELYDRERSHILIDFKEILSDPAVVDPKLDNIKVVAYLMTNSEILTDPYEIEIPNSEKDMCFATVLFESLFHSIIRQNKIYLVLIITEEVAINSNASRSKAALSSFTEPFIPFQTNGESIIHHVRRGVGAGVIDISPVFSKQKGIANADTPHKFVINLFGSQFKPGNFDTASSLNSMDDTGSFSGWGSLVSNILSDSTLGIAINPRALSVSVTVKEILDESFARKVRNSNILSVKSIPMKINRDPTPKVEAFYLTLGCICLCDVTQRETNIKNVAVHISSKNKNVRFCYSQLGEKKTKWNFVSVKPGESIGETIRIEGLEFMENDESLRVLVYLNGFLMAKSNICIRKNGQFIEFKKFTGFQLMSSMGQKLINLQIKTYYGGSMFNIDKSIHDFFSATNNPDLLKGDTVKQLGTIIKNLHDAPLTQLVKHFSPLLESMLKIFKYVCNSHDDNGTEEVKRYIFSNLVALLNGLVVDDANDMCFFEDFYQKHSTQNEGITIVGIHILDGMSLIFEDGIDTWGNLGRQICKCFVHLLSLSTISCAQYYEDWQFAIRRLFRNVTFFMSSGEETIYYDQILILRAFPLCISALNQYFEPWEIVSVSNAIFTSCEQKDDTLKFAEKSILPEEEKYLGEKYTSLLGVITHNNLEDYLFNSEDMNEIRLEFISKCISWTHQPYLYHSEQNYEISATRVANTVIITLIEKVTDVQVLRNLIRLLPAYCSFFILIRKFCKKVNAFRTRRVFTKLFPNKISPISIPMDSIVNDEVVIEILLEIATIICKIAKVATDLYGDNPSFLEVIKLCENDVYFTSPLYVTNLTKETVFLITKTQKLFFKGDFYPAKKWLGVSALFARSTLTILTMCKDFVIKKYAPYPITKGDADIFEEKLWADYLTSLLCIANDKVSTLTRLAIIPRKAVFLISGNLKKQVSFVLNQCWIGLANESFDHDALVRYGTGDISSKQLQLLTNNPHLVREIFRFGLNRHLQAIKTSTNILWSMILSFWKSQGSLQLAINLCIPELFNAYQTGKFYMYDDELERFMTCLCYRIHVDINDVIYSSLMDFLEKIIGFLYIVSETYKIPAQQEFDDDRTAHRIEMFSYLLEADRPELFHKMVYDLFIHFIQKRDNVQAGLCLELLANTYEWDPNDFLPAISHPPFPEQSSFERKEYLFKEAARNFARGLKLEKALSIYKDLTKAYDEINYDLNGLAFVHDQIATIYTELQSVDRLVPTYFRVALLGFGFPNSLRNRMFIFEGLPFEHITSMHDRLLKIYHGSSIVQTLDEVDKLLINPPMGKYIHVCTVEPRLALSEEYSTSRKSEMNNKIRMYIENRNLRTFSQFRRLPGSKSVTDLWVEEYTYGTVNTFPTLMNRSEIIEVSRRKLSPLKNALRSLQLKIQELYGLENMCYKVIKEQGDYTSVLNELSRSITGTISAPINGGISQYKVFLNKENEDKFNSSELNILMSSFDELVLALSRCLILHSELSGSNIGNKSGHNLLVELFEENFADEIKRNRIDIHNMTLESIMKGGSRPSHIKTVVHKRHLNAHWERPNFSSSQKRSNDTTESTGVFGAAMLGRYLSSTRSLSRNGSEHPTVASSPAPTMGTIDT